MKYATSSGKIDDKHEVELEIAKSQMDDEYDLRKDNLGKIQKEKFAQVREVNHTTSYQTCKITRGLYSLAQSCRSN